MGDEPLGTQDAGSGVAGLKSNLTISSVSVINYDYQVTPVFQGLNYLLYVRGWPTASGTSPTCFPW